MLEYKIVNVTLRNIEEVLNEYAEKGWEFDKSIGDAMVVFRRKKKVNKKSVIPRKFKNEILK